MGSEGETERDDGVEVMVWVAEPVVIVGVAVPVLWDGAGW